MVNIPIHKIPSVLHIDLYKGYLEHAGFRVFAEREGRGGIERAKRERPGVIILDLRLPGLHGTDVLKILKETPETKDIPVIVLTNMTYDGDEALVKSLGAREIYVKARTVPRDIAEAVKKYIK